MGDTIKGVCAIICACLVWGSSPLYYKLLEHVPPLELLCHRTLWSLAIFGVLLSLQGRLGQVGALLRGRTAFLVALAALVISINWGGFILSVQIGMVVEASLGYFIFPLLMVVFGRLFFGELITTGKATALALATVAVTTLTLGLGVAPWLSFLLGGTFATYGVIKKTVIAGPIVSVTTEVLILAPLAVIWLLGTHFAGWEGIVGRNGAVFGTDLWDSMLLVASGLITAVPLVLFSYASRRLALSTVGLVQYLNPSLQFTFAVSVLGETVTVWHMIAFPLIWLALAIYSAEAFRQDRASRRAVIA
ncbi:EamA family transporter RarD [Aliiroseovarius sediminis]|uniref:EamA family transporter RarD n=1 Tax=Aliiroseovarius sediminis TaxID=2925839 RepID=UPI001F57244D|nr:EamA family transporter RarD [Aliiroseovarius sediminis]MCI2393370.1 EamA family transporter RarD [Aliiroseovarius sediminis]